MLLLIVKVYGKAQTSVYHMLFLKQPECYLTHFTYSLDLIN